METVWESQNMEGSDYIGMLEIECINNNFGDADYQVFEIYMAQNKLVFGSHCNIGFIQSGYMEMDDMGIDCNLQELQSELQTYYSDGKEHTSKIVVNDRM